MRHGYLHYPRRPRTFRFGRRRRAQIARAIIGNPSLMILDEPTTGL
ncbi:ATP-binding cassette domain-containing protein, partial [Actinotignum timonense]